MFKVHTQTQARSMYMPLFELFIHDALLECSITEWSATASLAEWGHFKHLSAVHRLIMMDTMKMVHQNYYWVLLKNHIFTLLKPFV